MCNKIYDVYVASCVEAGGIYHYKMYESKLQLVEVTRMDRPMYMIIEDDRMYILLRAPFDNGESGVVIYDIDDTGRLINPTEIISTSGKVACHIAVHREFIYCANYISGNVVRLPNPKNTLTMDGRTVSMATHQGKGVHPTRQEGPHTHFVGLTPDEKYLCVTDLGLDTIFIYNLDMTLHYMAKVPEGHGVRHLAFSEDGKWMFAVNELMSTVAAFSYCDGELELVDSCLAIPDSFEGETTSAAIRVKDGAVYISNRGHDTIAKVSFVNGKLCPGEWFDCKGNTPRDFIFADDMILCANQDANTVTVLDGSNGFKLTGRANVETPICVCVGMEI